MKLISGSTKLEKRIFPALWFGFLAFAAILIATTNGLLPALFPLGMMAFGYFLFKHMAWDLADEVIDQGDSLLFRKGKLEQSVQLKDIINISYTHMHSPERVVIYSRKNGPIGNELAFKPPAMLNPFSKSPIVEELIRRVDSARHSDY